MEGDMVGATLNTIAPTSTDASSSSSSSSNSNSNSNSNSSASNSNSNSSPLFTEWPPDPQEVTDWLVEPRLNASAPCPLGFVCDGERKANCTKIRAVSLAYGFGDVHAGGWCPEGIDQLQLCPVGHYCPTAEELYLCPATFYCPYKTAVFEIDCWGCGLGEETLVREWYGYILLGLLFLLMICWIIMAMVKRYKAELVARFVELSSRSLDSARRQLLRRKQRQEQLERLKPKLFAIQQRLEQLEQRNKSKKAGNASSSPSSTTNDSSSVIASSNSHNKNSASSSTTAPTTTTATKTETKTETKTATKTAAMGLSVQDSSRVKYQAGRLFDALDVDHDGQLNFQELQQVLELQPLQLKAFVQRMNELAIATNTATTTTTASSAAAAASSTPNITATATTSVSREVFTKYFLRVLEESTHFGPTREEVQDLFDELASPHGEEVAAYADFFESRLTLFLTDPQINEVVTRLRKAAIQEQGVTNTGERLRQERTTKNTQPIANLSTQGEAELQEQEQEQEQVIERDQHQHQHRDKEFSESFLGMAGVMTSQSSAINVPNTTGGQQRQAHSSQRSRRLSTIFSVRSFFTPAGAITSDPKRYVHRDLFVKYYAQILSQVTMASSGKDGDSILEHELSENDGSLPVPKRGIDLAFENLSLAVSVGNNKVNVVNRVSGRLPAKTMTALMGGSGAGKTSLLNALCGRAFYGETTGTIRINGHVTSIEEHKSSTGFVPQDDIVHAELTVRENLLYSGRFTLPAGTKFEAIEELADRVLAQLGLSRVADSLVGDVNRRGVSGGEKKRVNIGVELMSRPSILFLDEPTSGLDSSSALLVMQSLKSLTETQGVTVLSVIHQPRKAIFDSFDSLVLLGVGGNMVYHGPVFEAQNYFEGLAKPYVLPPGESLADWLIDVSSGRLTPKEAPKSKEDAQDSDEVEHVDGEEEDDEINTIVSTCAASSAKFEFSIEKAKERRQELYDCWNRYYEHLSGLDRDRRYTPPAPYALPVQVQKPRFSCQLRGQVQRNLLITWRNRTSKLVDTTMLVGAVVLISWLQGVLQVTRDQPPGLSFDQLVEGDPYEIPTTFPSLFKYALGPTSTSVEFALKIGVITAVLLGLMAAKALTSSRLEFFREAGSGWDINAYFLALNLTSTFEHAIQMMIAAGCSYWLRDSLANWYAYQVQFIMLMWVTVSWSLLIPLLVPANNTVLAVGFFMAFFGLLFSGAIDPVTYQDIYEGGNSATALFSGFTSVTRFFIEGITVQEQRCLPAQSGFTVEPTSTSFPVDLVGSFHLVGLAQNDLSVIQQSFNGWYWGVPSCFMVGLSLRVLAGGVLHISDRSKQAKKSMWYDLSKRPISQNKTIWIVISFTWLVVIMFVFSGWLMLNQVGETGTMAQPSTEEEAIRLAERMTIENTFPGQASDFGTGA